MNKFPCLLLIILILSACTSPTSNTDTSVKIIGEMKNVMWKGELSGIIDLDTISNKEDLYGMGPVEYLAGEIMIIDGKSFKSKVVNDSTMKVEETFKIKAPFFGYAHIPDWTEHTLPAGILTIAHLEKYLDSITRSSSRPFMFKLKGMVEEAKIH